MDAQRTLNWYICEMQDGSTFHAYAVDADEAALDANYVVRGSGTYVVNVHLEAENVEV
jgi:hypothetical protein